MTTSQVAGKPHPLRRQYVVNRRYQGRFTLALLATVLGAGLLTFAVVYPTMKAAVAQAMYRIHLPTSAIWEMIRTPLLWTNLGLAVLSLLIAGGVVVLLVRRSSKLLAAIEGEVGCIDAETPPDAFSRGNALWSGAGKDAGLSLESRLGPFREAHAKLAGIQSRIEAESREGSVAARSSIITALDGVVRLLEQGRSGFQC